LFDACPGSEVQAAARVNAIGLLPRFYKLEVLGNMKLNKIEFALMNNPIRAFIQEKHEIAVLRKMFSLANIENALEIGCGNGYGTKLIKKYFRPRRIDAVDLDEKND
jgi:methylase of polypeptide subunit release factors